MSLITKPRCARRSLAYCDAARARARYETLATHSGAPAATWAALADRLERCALLAPVSRSAVLLDRATDARARAVRAELADRIEEARARTANTALGRVVIVRRATRWWVVAGHGLPDLGPYGSLWEAGQVASGISTPLLLPTNPTRSTT